jgi:hypothetical protein
MKLAYQYGITDNANWLANNFVNESIMYNTLNGYGYSFGTRIENIVFWVNMIPKFLTIVDLYQDNYFYDSCEYEISFYTTKESFITRKPTPEDYLIALRELNIE